MTTPSTDSSRWARVSLGLGQGLLVLFVAFVLASLLAVPATGALVAAGLVAEGTAEWRVARTVFQFAGFALAAVGFLAFTRDRELILLDAVDARDVAVVVVTILVLLAVQIAAIVALGAVGRSTGRNVATEAGQAGPVYFLFMIAVSLLVVGPAEELLFRGVVQGLLRRAWSAWPAIVLASLIFGLIHVPAVSGSLPEQLAYAAVAAVLGGVLGYVYERTRNLLVPALAHGGYNASLFAIQYAAAIGLVG